MGYDAFISYSHSADLDLAPAVREGLQRLAKPWNKRRALSIFLDQASLELSSELGGSLDERIEDTRWLILFMSERSAESKWVGEEISEWAEKKSKDQLALVLTSGEVVWDDEAKDFDYERSTAVSEGMRGVYTGQDSEPLFLDLRWTKDLPDGEKSLDLTNLKFRDAIATLAAPIHGMPKDQLEGEDIRQFRLARRLRRAAVTGLAFLTVAAVTFGIVARIQRNRSEARRLATVASSNAAEQTDLALLLALQSLDTRNTPEGWGALFDALSRSALARSPMAGHAAGVNRLVFHPDGSVMASMGNDGIVGLWDPAAERQVGRFQGHPDGYDLTEAAFSPDGSILATPGYGGLVRLWDAETGSPLGDPLSGHEALVWDVAFSPDGTLLATAGADSTVRLWDLERREPREMASLGDRIQVWEVAFSPDGSRLQWVSSDGSLRSGSVLSASTGDVLLAGHDEWSEGSTAPGVEFSHDGTKLAVASGDWTVQLWDLKRLGAAPLSLRGHDGFVVDLAFSPDDARLASASQDRTVRMWDVAAGEQLGNTLTGHDAEVFSVGFSPDGELLASGSGDRSIRLWDLGAGESVGRQLNHGEWARAVSVSPDGLVAAAAGDSRITLWDVVTGELRLDAQGAHDGEWVNSVAFSPDSKLLASAGNDGKVRVWNVETGLPAGDPLAGHGDWVNDAVFSPDGKLLASAGDDQNVRLWDLASGAEIGSPLGGHEDVVSTVALSPDGTKLASTGRDNTVRLWEVGTGKALSQEPTRHEAKVLGARFGPEGTYLLSASGDGVVLRRDLLTWGLEKVLDAKVQWTAVAFAADGRSMASASPDASLRLWDLTTGSQAGVALRGHSKRVEALDFGPDELLLASASEDRTIRLWPPQERWPELACAAVGRNLSVGEWEEFVGSRRSYRRQCAQHPAAELTRE